MAGIEVATLIAKLDADVRDFDRDFKKAEQRIKGFDQNVSRSSSQIGGAFKGLAKTAALTFGAAGVVGFMKSGVDAASDLEESVNAVRVVFGDAADSVLAFSADTNDAVFEAEGKLNQMATTTGALLTNFGFTADEAAKETITLTQRAADMASVFNVDVSEAMGAIQQALRGETEAIRRFGGNVDEASIKTYALAQNIWDGTEAMTQNEKVAARVGLIMEQTAKVQGDAANTADSYQNQMRRLNEQFYQAQVALGQALLPVLVEILPHLIALIEPLTRALLPVLEQLGPIIKQVLVPGLELLADVTALLPGPIQLVTGVWGDLVGGIISGGQSLMNLVTLNGDWADALHVVKQGLLFVVDPLGLVRAGIGLLSGETRTGADTISDLQTALRNAVDFAAGPFNAVTLTMRDIIRDTAVAQGEMRQAAILAGQAIHDEGGDMVALSSASNGAVTSVRSLRQAQLELTDPVYAAQSALERMNSTLERVMEDGRLTNAEFAELGRVTLEANAAMDQVDGANIAGTMSMLQSQLGLTSDEANAVVREMLSIDGMNVLAYADLRGNINNALDYAGDMLRYLTNTSWVVYAKAVVTDTSGNVTGFTLTSGSVTLTAMAEGGPVTAGAPYLIGEEGPELFVPRTAGTIIPNDAATGGGTAIGGSIGGGGVTVNVYGDVLTEDMLLDKIRSGLARSAKRDSRHAGAF